MHLAACHWAQRACETGSADWSRRWEQAAVPHFHILSKNCSRRETM